MMQNARRRQPSITIRSERASALLRRLATGGRSQAEIIEQALEQMASRRMTLGDALAPTVPQSFDWEPARSGMAARTADFDD